MQQDKVLSMIGLAKKAGAVSAGEMKCSDAIKKRKARLVIIADDASDNTKKSIKNSCAYYNALYIEYSQKNQLGRMCGYDAVSVLSVNDDNFAKGINRIFENIGVRDDIS